jgi:Domain of unknown function (DUF4190)
MSSQQPPPGPPAYPPPPRAPDDRPAYPPPPSQQPSWGPPPSSHLRNNGLAVASMVLGIVGILFFVFFAIVPALALIFGLVSHSQIRQSAGTQGGSGMAVAGIVLGAVGVALFFLVLPFGSFNVHFGG